MTQHPIYHEPTDPPAIPMPVVVSSTLFDLLAGSLGASNVEADDTHQYVWFNGLQYATALVGAA